MSESAWTREDDNNAYWDYIDHCIHYCFHADIIAIHEKYGVADCGKPECPVCPLDIEGGEVLCS